MNEHLTIQSKVLCDSYGRLIFFYGKEKKRIVLYVANSKDTQAKFCKNISHFSNGAGD